MQARKIEETIARSARPKELMFYGAIECDASHANGNHVVLALPTVSVDDAELTAMFDVSATRFSAFVMPSGLRLLVLTFRAKEVETRLVMPYLSLAREIVVGIAKRGCVTVYTQARPDALIRVVDVPFHLERPRELATLLNGATDPGFETVLHECRALLTQLRTPEGLAHPPGFAPAERVHVGLVSPFPGLSTSSLQDEAQGGSTTIH